MKRQVVEVSGWIFPDGQWRSVEEWWHLNAIYEWRDKNDPFASLPSLQPALNSGDEASIRHALASEGFAKISRGVLDTYTFSDLQLRTLQTQLEDFDYQEELVWVAEGAVEKKMSLERLLKLKRAAALFPSPKSQEFPKSELESACAPSARRTSV
jgi:hypothetical protein